MTLALPLSASFIIIFSFICVFLRFVFVFEVVLCSFFLLGNYSTVFRRICSVQYVILAWEKFGFISYFVVKCIYFFYF